MTMAYWWKQFLKDDSGIFGSSWRGGVRDLRASLIPTSRVGGVHRDGDGDGDDRYGGGFHRGDEDDGNGDDGGVPLDGRDGGVLHGKDPSIFSWSWYHRHHPGAQEAEKLHYYYHKVLFSSLWLWL